MSSHKTIAKNTMFLYVRMFLIMGITLYTSRIVLEELGVSDYGIYNLVGGIVAMMGFFNGAMSSATQRYLAHDIGKGDFQQLQKTFSATLTVHFGIAILGLIIAETLGLWYVNYKMVFPIEKSYAVNVVYQFSILTFLLSIIQVPYNALIIARERMKVYAYMSILEAVLKLGTVFTLMLISTNKLIYYAGLTFVVSFIIRMLYQVYCRKQFKESKYHFVYDRLYFMELISYSGWSLFGNVASVAKGQGINLVLNLFFGTVVNAAYAITNQIVSAVNLFATNLQMAFNPQIIKNYSQGNLVQTQNLIFQGSKISFFLLLILIMPILLNTEYILVLWLNEVPEYTTLFVQLALIGVLIESLSGTLMTGAQATGKIKWYQIVIGTLIFLNLPISYIALKLGFNASITFIISIIISMLSLIFRLFFLKRILNFNIIKYIKKVIVKVLCVVGIMIAYYYFYTGYINNKQSIITFLIDSILITIFLVSIIYIIVLTKEEKSFLLTFIKNKTKWKVSKTN
ncbi:MATE family efflux transporter [Empedobacter falsenii]|uniref:MATE family efflux transporter n=1 Tax=Empedobacter falsenii TaxID=343874 RepID=UPI003A7FDB48